MLSTQQELSDTNPKPPTRTSGLEPTLMLTFYSSPWVATELVKYRACKQSSRVEPAWGLALCDLCLLQARPGTKFQDLCLGPSHVSRAQTSGLSPLGSSNIFRYSIKHLFFSIYNGGHTLLPPKRTHCKLKISLSSQTSELSLPLTSQYCMHAVDD